MEMFHDGVILIFPPVALPADTHAEHRCFFHSEIPCELYRPAGMFQIRPMPGFLLLKDMSGHKQGGDAHAMLPE